MPRLVCAPPSVCMILPPPPSPQPTPSPPYPPYPPPPPPPPRPPDCEFIALVEESVHTRGDGGWFSSEAVGKHGLFAGGDPIGENSSSLGTNGSVVRLQGTRIPEYSEKSGLSVLGVSESKEAGTVHGMATHNWDSPAWCDTSQMSGRGSVWVEVLLWCMYGCTNQQLRGPDLLHAGFMWGKKK